MPFARLNGLTLPVATWTENWDRSANPLQRAFSGTPIRNEYYRKRRWQVQTPPIPQSDALALIALIDGLGDSITFDVSETVTGKGIEPTGTYTVNASGGVYAKDIDVTSGNTFSIQVGTFTDWTLLHWKDGSFYAYTSAGVTYDSIGVSSDDADDWLTYAGGTLQLEGKSDTGVGATASYDEIYFVPALLSADQIAGWYSYQQAVGQLAQLPRTTLYGDCVDNVPTDVQGLVSSAVAINLGTDEYYQLTFELWEV